MSLLVSAGRGSEADHMGIKVSTWKGPMSPPLTMKASPVVIPILTGVREATQSSAQESWDVGDSFSDHLPPCRVS